MKRRESIALSPAELAALADAMPQQWRALTLVSGWCGLRIGEAAGLRHGDVDLEHGLLRIVQTAQYLGTQLVIGPPKSARGVRIVHMPRHVTDALAEFITGKNGWKPKDLIWTRSDGQAISRHTTLKAFQSASRSIGRDGMVWHDLRHTANTLAADAGASQATLQARMGHADPKVSAIYLHTSTSHDRDLADALSEMATRSERTRSAYRAAVGLVLGPSSATHRGAPPGVSPPPHRRPDRVRQPAFSEHRSDFEEDEDEPE